MNKVIISVGSNINPKENIKKAEKILKKHCLFLNKSKFLKTKAIGSLGPDFLNGAFYIKTKFNKEELKKYLINIESSLGRIRTKDKNAPRTIDLDIIFFQGEVIDEDFYKYDFVKKSVLELLSKNNLKIENSKI